MLYESLTISEVVTELTRKGYETSSSQIRKLERLGIISLDREGKNRRVIGPSSMEKLEIVFALRSIGVSLKAIKDLLDLRDLFLKETDFMGQVGFNVSKPDSSLAYFLETFEENIVIQRKKYRDAVQEINHRFNSHIRCIEKAKENINFYFTKE